MNNMEWESNDNATDLSKADKFSSEQLRAMQFVARMKEAADKMGAGFVGGFISPTGQRFMMSNVDADDEQMRAVNEQLDAAQEQHVELLKLDQLRKLLEEFEG